MFLNLEKRKHFLMLILFQRFQKAKKLTKNRPSEHPKNRLSSGVKKRGLIGSEIRGFHDTGFTNAAPNVIAESEMGQVGKNYYSNAIVEVKTNH